MQDMLRALRSELLKTKNSLALWMSFIAPLAIVGLVFLVGWDEPASRGTESWIWYGQSVMTFWTYAFVDAVHFLGMCFACRFGSPERPLEDVVLIASIAQGHLLGKTHHRRLTRWDCHGCIGSGDNRLWCFAAPAYAGHGL